MPHFPQRLRSQPKFDGPFDAYKLAAGNCDVLMASYPAGTELEAHTHETNNVGVITQGAMLITVDGEERRYEVGEWYEVTAGTSHSARTEVDTSEIEFWFHD